MKSTVSFYAHAPEPPGTLPLFSEEEFFDVSETEQGMGEFDLMNTTESTPSIYTDAADLIELGLVQVMPLMSREEQRARLWSDTQVLEDALLEGGGQIVAGQRFFARWSGPEALPAFDARLLQRLRSWQGIDAA